MCFAFWLLNFIDSVITFFLKKKKKDVYFDAFKNWKSVQEISFHNEKLTFLKNRETNNNYSKHTNFL